MIFALVFVVWVAYGVWLSVHHRKVFRSALSWPEGRRKALAPLLMVLGAGAFLAVLMGTYQFKMLTGPPLTAFVGMLMVTLAGGVFVHLQAMAAVLITSIVVTSRPAITSEQKKDSE